jgi:hypothetical protein
MTSLSYPRLVGTFPASNCIVSSCVFSHFPSLLSHFAKEPNGVFSFFRRFDTLCEKQPGYTYIPSAPGGGAPIATLIESIFIFGRLDNSFRIDSYKKRAARGAVCA